MNRKYLLGATQDHQIVFGKFDLEHPRYWTKELGSYVKEDELIFSACFDTVRPFNGNEVDLVQYFEDSNWGMDKEYLYDLCEYYECSPQDLAKNQADKCRDPRDVIDCSVYPITFKIDDDYWYFESRCGGQYDTRKDMAEYVNKEAYDLLHELWDKYHLKNISGKQEVMDKINKITELLEMKYEEKWITNYIKRTF